jgi:fructokinase
MSYRIGIDLGGTKIELIVLGPDGSAILRRRMPTPHGYAELQDDLKTLILRAEAEIGATATVGIGIPGRISPVTGLAHAPNVECLSNHPFDTDFAATLGRPVRVGNDANCFALSEATDGAAAGAKVVFGVILGTGCGGGITVNGQLVEGRNGISGEWGHNPLPWISEADLPLRPCPCGHIGCIERYVAGPALASEVDGAGARDASHVLERAQAGEEAAQRAIARHAERLARALASVSNLLDPDVIVIGGGLSNLPYIYSDVPPLMQPFIAYPDGFTTSIVQSAHGDSSGVRGAAWLWPTE